VFPWWDSLWWFCDSCVGCFSLFFSLSFRYK